MKAFLIAGSPAESSRTLGLANSIAEELVFKGHEAVVWDLAEKPLAAFEPRFHYDQRLVGDRAQDFLKELNESSMVVLSTPLYHGSYSGALKNALDYLVKDQFNDKPVGLACNGGLAKASQAISHMLQITQTLYGIPMQTQIVTSADSYEESAEGFELTDEASLDRVKRLVEELDRYSELLRS